MLWVSLIFAGVIIFYTREAIKKDDLQIAQGITVLFCFIIIMQLFGCHCSWEREEELKKEKEQLEIKNEELEEKLDLKTASEKMYWQSTNSGVIHNSTCFWYAKSDGRYIDDPSYGRDCLECGGRKSK